MWRAGRATERGEEVLNGATLAGVERVSASAFVLQRWRWRLRSMKRVSNGSRLSLKEGEREGEQTPRSISFSARRRQSEM